MSPAVSQVSRSTKTRLRFLRRLVILVVLLVVAAIALAQFTELKRLATGSSPRPRCSAAIVGFAAQHTIGNMVAGVQLAVSQPIKIGDRIELRGSRAAGSPTSPSPTPTSTPATAAPS